MRKFLNELCPGWELNQYLSAHKDEELAWKFSSKHYLIKKKQSNKTKHYSVQLHAKDFKSSITMQF